MTRHQPDGIVGRVDLARMLRASYRDWVPDDGDIEQLQSERDAARVRLEAAGADPDDLGPGLSLHVDSNQLFWAVDQACRKKRSRLLDVESASAIVAKMFPAPDGVSQDKLRILADVQVRSLAIPDVAKDELVLFATVSTGVDFGEFLAFCVRNQLLSPAQCDTAVESWKHSDQCIGATAEECKALEWCLGMSFESTLHEAPRSISYNFWDESGMLYRVCDMVVTLHHALDYHNYPFDRTILEFRLTGDGRFDFTEREFAPDTPSLELEGATMPRGFDLAESSRALLPVAISWGEELVPDCLMRFGLVVERRADTSIWRRFIPIAVVLAFALVNVLLALITGRYAESVTTGVLPGVLIASVALQLSSAQHVPAHTGPNVFDGLFTAIYIHLILLLAALLLKDSPVRWIPFGLAVAVAAYGILFVVMRSRQPIEMGSLSPVAAGVE